MATPILITGWEHGVATPVTSGAGLCNNVVGTPSVSADWANSGTYSLKIDQSGSTEYLTYTIGSGTVLVGRVYFRYTTLPNALADLFAVFIASGTYAYLSYQTADSSFRFGFHGSSSDTASTIVPVVNTTYRVDFRINVGANPWTIDWSINGTTQTQHTRALGASTIGNFYAGSHGSVTETFYLDDLVLSSTSADYPIGAGGTEGLKPSSDGTHNAGANVIENDAGDDIGGAVTAYNLVNKVPLSDATHYIRQAADGAVNYAAVNFADISTSHDAIIGASALLAYTAASTSANTGGCIVTKDNFSSSTTLHGAPGALADYSDGSTSAPYYKRVIVAGVVDDTAVNALAARMGYSDDANPDPYWVNLMVEVAYTESTSAGQPTEIRRWGTPTRAHNDRPRGWN